ncbi:transcriptional regulator NrdR [Patescibacteria group bacterium]|nr:transcriptional regulator NrdR [Patescibacteria group bacterium]MCG2701666.1 transcriptional regulator NrdR [Candidatus Parcubacteria bacterium]MBU4210878.1 transcriptional regulator NrdR [Patescibacteria group bacterium]MBU4265014.1 transcriptional regulator NrdR [Patescibacteria group bacterium]MBU4390167.1 transcriptional regulator NrdR [Patescibacteria group bacterium]
MLCPYCSFNGSNVLESRDAREAKATRRRRECLGCKKRFTTYEEAGGVDLKVVKKDKRIEDYDREKLGRCLEKSCWRMSTDEREKMLDGIEMELLNWPSVEIPSKEIARMLMNRLKKIDPVAYIRFATVYLDIKDVKGFERLIKGFNGGKKSE